MQDFGKVRETSGRFFLMHGALQNRKICYGTFLFEIIHESAGTNHHV